MFMFIYKRNFEDQYLNDECMFNYSLCIVVVGYFFVFSISFIETIRAFKTKNNKSGWRYGRKKRINKI